MSEAGQQAVVVSARPMSALTFIPSADDLRETWKLGEVLVKTGFLPRAIDTPAKAVAVALKGRELGIGPMTAWGTIHIIEGKPTSSAELMMALAFARVKGFGVRVESDDKACTITFKRDGSEPFTYSYTMEDARRAGDSSKTPYNKHPKAMLAARCKGQGLRLYCPDAVLGLYAYEELDFDPEAKSSDAELAKPLPAHPAPREREQSRRRAAATEPVAAAALEAAAGAIADESAPAGGVKEEAVKDDSPAEPAVPEADVVEEPATPAAPEPSAIPAPTAEECVALGHQAHKAYKNKRLIIKEAPIGSKKWWLVDKAALTRLEYKDPSVGVGFHQMSDDEREKAVFVLRELITEAGVKP